MGWQQRELRRQLKWLMAFRVVITTTLLVCVFVIELLYRPLLPLRPFYLLAISTYLLTIGYALLMRVPRGIQAQVYVQLIGDISLLTAFVYFTGGSESPFSFLYLPSIIVGCILLPRRQGGFAVAAWSWILYACLVLLIHNGVVPRYPAGPFEEGEVATVRILYSLLAHLVSFFALAYLATHLTESLRRTGQELQMRRDDLADLRAFNEDIIDSINSGLLTCDGEGRVTFANRAAGAISGHAPEALVGRNMLEVLSQERPFLWQIQRALAREKRYRFELDYSDSAGRDLFLGFTVSELRARSGTPLGMIFVFQDLTDIRVLEEEVALKKRMAALGEMAAGVAHELRNPLASISGSVQVLKRDLRPTPEAAELMDIVVKESKRLDGIIRDFLMFAKPGRFEPETADLGRLVRETLSLLENSEERRPHHRVLMEIPGGSIHTVVDVNRIRQVFWNLAKNALKAMPEGGTLTVSAAQDAEGHSVVIFTDTGIGMSERDVAENFQPFHGSFRGGTGLGLAIVYRIVEEHGGRIRVQSRQGRGTQIAVHLPRRVLAGKIEERQWTAS
jgi:two-component system sensor histidine kinase PilS (NtrC family)